MMIDVSIIIVNCNTRELLRDCLDAIRTDDLMPRREIIVVDNASVDGSREMLKGQYPEVRVLLNDHNEGFAKPNNDGLAVARGRYLFLLNSDTRIERQTVKMLVDFLADHPDAGACGPRLVYPDGRLQRSVSDSHSLRTHLFDMLFLDRLFPGKRFFAGGEMTGCPYDPDLTQAVPQLMGAAFMIRREVMERTGVFDERLSIYYNEMDWFMRMQEDGWKVYYVPTTTIVHHRGATTAKMNFDFQQFHEMYANVLYFFRKHYGSWAPVAYRILLIAGFVPRLCLWSLRSLMRPSDLTAYMQLYSRKVLLLGLRWWRGADVPEAHRH
jgi:GT2 family glycosyltransferase